MKCVFLVWVGVVTSRNDLVHAAASVVTLLAATKVQLGLRSGRTTSAFGHEPNRRFATVIWNVLPTKLFELFWSNVQIALAIAPMFVPVQGCPGGLPVRPANFRFNSLAPDREAASAAFCSSVFREYV